MSAPLRSLKTVQPARLAAAALTFTIWALLAASVLWWWLHTRSSAAAPEAPVAGRASTDIDGAAVARVLGSTGAATAPQAPETKDAGANDARFALRGVLTHGADGAALVAVGGQVRPVRVGAPVGDDAKGWTLHEALPHAVVLAGDGRQVRLEMPGEEERTRLIKERAAQAPQTTAPAPRLAPAPAPEPRQQPASRARWRRIGADGQPGEPQDES